MNDDFDALNDHLVDLERDLKARAVAAPSLQSAGRWRLPHAVLPVAGAAVARPLVAVPVVVAGAIAFAVIAGVFAGNAPPAYGQPAILDTPAMEVPPQMRGGLALELAVGPGSTLDEARPFDTSAGTGYLLSGGDAWCLSAPDPDADRPASEPGVGCVRTAEFMRIGLAIVVGRHYVAAIPRGVDSPTVTSPDGTQRDLQPDEFGVVATTLEPGDSVTRYDIDGRKRTDARG